MPEVLKTTEEIEAQGYSDAMEAIRDSGSTDEPCDGWDSWLINAVGTDATCRLFDEDPAESADGWSDAMTTKLAAYCEGCREACRVCDGRATDEEIQELGILTTKDEAGRHFTQWSEHWEKLEEMGLIAINRPVHAATGLPYDSQYWTLEVTEAGLELLP